MRHRENVTEYVKKEIQAFGRKTIYFQNDYNQPVQTTMSLPNKILLSTSEDLNKTVTFRLYTPEVKDNYEPLKINDSHLLAKSHFNTKRPTRFVTHGFLASGDGPSCTLIRDGNSDF